jgi:hypothetical protein
MNATGLTSATPTRKGKIMKRPVRGAVVVLVSALFASTLLAVTPAQATVIGEATLTPSTGNADSIIAVATPAPCAAPAVKVRVIVTGFGFPALGKVVYSPQTTGFSTENRMNLSLSNTFFVYATAESTALVGDYDIRAQCVNSLGTIIFDEFSTTMRWTTPGNLLANVASATYTSGALPPAATIKPSVAGTAKVGYRLACARGTWTNATSYAYRWKRNGVAISGAIASTYLLAGGEYRKSISCQVTATGVGGSTSVTSAGRTIVAGTIAVRTKPYIYGTVKVGKTIKTTKGAWRVAGLTYTYQWKRNGVSISGTAARKYFYKVVAKDKRKYLTCTVRVAKYGYTSTTSTTARKKAA